MMIPPSIPRQLVHVLHNLEPGSITAHMLNLVQALFDYRHTVLFEGSVLKADAGLVRALWMAGASVFHVNASTPYYRPGEPAYGEITGDMLRWHDYSAAVLYSLTGHAYLGKVLPSIYYSYGIYDPASESDVVICCTEYAKHNNRTSNYWEKVPENTQVIHPGIQSRFLRTLKRDNPKPVVGLCSSTAFGKYPEALARYLIDKLDRGIPLCIAAIDEWKQRLQTVATSCNRPVTFVDNGHSAPYRMYRTADIWVHGFSQDYHSPYTRTVIEAMCAGIPVVCQRSGFLADQLVHGQHCLFFDKRKEALDHVNLLLKEPDTAKQISLNGRLWALGQDHTVYTNEFRKLLRQLGV